MFLAGSVLMNSAVLLVPATAEVRPAAKASVQNIRYLAESAYTRVIIDLDSDARYENGRLTGPDRVYFDFFNAGLSSDFLNRGIPSRDEFLKQVRVARNRPDVVRVVLDVSENVDCRVFELHNPFRIVVDIYGPSKTRAGINPSINASTAGLDEVRLLHAPKPVSAAIPNVQKPLKPPVLPEETSKSQLALPAVIGNAASQVHQTTIVSVQKIRYRPSSTGTQVVIDLDSDTRYENARLANPDRIYFDILNARLSSDFQNRALAVKDEFLKQVRVAQNQSELVRVVLDVSGAVDYRVSELHNPSCIVVDLIGPLDKKTEYNPLPNPSEPRPLSIAQKIAPKRDGIAGENLSRRQDALASTEMIIPGGSGYIADSRMLPLAIAAAPSTPEEAEPLPPAPGSGIMIIKPPAVSAKKSANIIGRNPDSSQKHDRPLTIEGTLTSGYYSSYTRGGGSGDQRINFVPAGATFDANGFYMTPDLLDYSVQTELNAGSQASDAGFDGGNGVRTRITALRKGAFPMTFRYTNVQLKDAYFGSLTQVSSYTQRNRNKDLGLTAALNIAGLPAATVDWGTSSVQSQSFTSAIPDYTSHSDHLNLNCSDQRWGWDFQCFAGRQQQVSDLFTPLIEGTGSSLLRQKVTQYRGSARRSFLGDSELYLEGGSQSTANIVLDQPIDLTTRYASANLRMFQRKRWKTSLRAGYTSNIAGLVLTQLVGGLSGNGSIAPDAAIVQSLRRTTSYLNLSGLTSVDLSHGLGLYGTVDRTAVLTAGGSDLNSRYITTAAGMTYARTFGWGSLSGQYGRSFGIGSVTGQTGRIEGQNYVFTAQPGKSDTVQFDFSIRGSDQSVRNTMPAKEHSFASDMGIGLRVLGQFHARLGGGWQRSAFSNQGNEFRTTGYTARAGIEHPRFQLNGSWNSSIGNSLQSYGQILSGIGTESAILTPLRLVPSDLQGVTITLHLIPIRKLEFSGLFTHSVQHLEGVVANDFEVMDIYVTFHLRKLQFVAGYFASTQLYSSYLAVYPETQRGRFYIRIARPAKFL